MNAPWLALALTLVPAPVPPGSDVKDEPRPLGPGLTSFAIDLLRATDDAAGNVDVAPISVARALAMARSGAGGETAAQIDRALHFDGVEVSRRFRALGDSLEVPEIKRRDGTQVKPFQLELSSAFFLQRGFTVLPAFDDGLRNAFGSEGVRVDFKFPEKAAGTINAWVDEHTRGRLKTLVEPTDLSSDCRIVLADAVFFRAAWESPFETHDTRTAKFTTAEGREIEVPMMRRVDRYGYGETERATVLEVAHEKGLTSMVFVLPKAGVSTRDLVDREDFAQWFACTKERTWVDANLPKFTCDRRVELRRALTALGVVDLFDAKACDLSGITTKEPLYVSDVIHRARLAIDEAGTEAAAATAIVFKAGSSKQPTTVPFVADRPFLFALRHKSADLVMFCGRIDDPTAK